MTTIYQADHLPPTSAQTHVLLIGVGRYPYVQQTKTGLTPLMAPVASVRDMADWLLQTPLHNPAAPLGTVEVLLSALDAADQHYALADGSTLALDAATWPNIRRTFDRWLQHCNQSPGNVALFYFCGHGLQKEQTLALLPETFGLSLANEWADTINFTETYAGLRATCKAQTQCYVVDACRQVDLATLRTGAFGGQALCKGDALSRNNPASLVLYAAERGAAAFAEANNPSRLTAVVLQALQTSDLVDGKIDLATLARRTPLLMEEANRALPAAKHQRAVAEVVGDGARPLHYTTKYAGTPPIPPTAPGTPAVQAAKLSPDEEAFLRDQLAQHQRNRRTLLKQKSIYGAGEAPLRLLNQIEAEEEAIEKIRQQLGKAAA